MIRFLLVYLFIFISCSVTKDIEWSTDRVIIDPNVGTYLEKNYYSLYFKQNMKSFKYIINTFRNGNFGGKQIHNEIVRICRAEANLESHNELVYLVPSWTDYKEPIVDTSGYNLYRVKLKNGAFLASSNYTSTLGDKGTGYHSVNWFLNLSSKG